MKSKETNSEHKKSNCSIENVDDGKTMESSSTLQNFGKFQILSLAMLSPTTGCIGMTIMSFVFLNLIPKYKCKTTNYNTSTQYNYSSLPSLDQNQCFSYNISNSSSINSKNYHIAVNSYIANYSANTVACSNGWSYDYSKGNTIVSEFDLICKSAWKRPFTVSCMMLGMLVGSLLGGRFSDRFGRKKTCSSAFLSHALLKAILSLSPNYVFYLIFTFSLGISQSMTYTSIFVWSQEIAHTGDRRALASFCIHFGYSVGGMAMSLIAYYALDWNWIYRITAIIEGVCFPILWYSNLLSYYCAVVSAFLLATCSQSFVSESHSWLLQKRRTQEPSEVLKKIISANKKLEAGQNNHETKSFEKQSNNDKEGIKKLSPTLLLTNSVLRRRIMIVCFIWNVCFLSFYTMSLNTVNIGGNVYVNNVLGNAFDVGSSVAVILLLKKFSRKKTLAGLLLALTIFSFSTPLTRQANEIVGVTFALVSRFFGSTSMWVIILFTGEIFPTLLRNTSVGIASMSSSFSSILSPYLIFLGEELDLSIPFYVMSGMAFLGCFLVVMLPETSKSVLPNSLEDALKLNDGKCGFPKLGKRSNQKHITSTKEHTISTISDNV